MLLCTTPDGQSKETLSYKFILKKETVESCNINMK